MEFVKIFGSRAVTNKNLLRTWDAFEKSILSNSRKLFLISDFDHTLTTFNSVQCHDIVALNEAYPPSFHADFRDTFKIKDREESWRVSHDLIVQRSGLTRSMFLEALRKSDISLRPGTSKLLSFCRKSQIPTIVTSAGFANVIYTTMESYGVATSINDHFYVDANFLEFSDDNDGVLERITPERPVHSEAKKYMPLRLGHLLPLKPRLSAPENDSKNKMVKSQISSTALEPPLHLHYLHGLPLSMQLSALDGDAAAIMASEGIAAIVLGDRPADFEVLSEVAGASMFRIGFAVSDEKADELLGRDCCDVVLIGPEHSVDPVLHTLQKLSEIRDFHLRQSSRDVSLVPYRPPRPKSRSLVEVK